MDLNPKAQKCKVERLMVPPATAYRTEILVHWDNLEIVLSPISILRWA